VDLPGSTLTVQNDENVVIYHGGTPVWGTNTSLLGTPVKGTGPRVYLLESPGVRRWIRDPETSSRATVAGPR
jgi:hypothetical protein